MAQQEQKNEPSGISAVDVTIAETKVKCKKKLVANIRKYSKYVANSTPRYTAMALRTQCRATAAMLSHPAASATLGGRGHRACLALT